MGKIHLIAFLLCLVVSVPVMAFSPCLTSTNSEHVTQGRGMQTTGTRGEGVYAVGSGDYLGADAGRYVSLFESSGIVSNLLIYYRDELGYEPVDFSYVSNGTYRLTFYKSSCGCLEIFLEPSAWIVAQCDSDQDNLPDAYEQDMFGNLDQDGSTDKDQDGASDYLEYMTNSDPRDANQRPVKGNYYRIDELSRLRQILRAQ